MARLHDPAPLPRLEPRGSIQARIIAPSGFAVRGVRYAEEAITLAAMERGEVSAEIPILVLNELFVLDRPRLEDAKAARRFALDPDAARYFGWTIEQARAQPDSHYEDGIRQFAREWNDGTRFELTIRRRSDGEPVGLCWLGGLTMN
jgi:RimJ/RimL family protein N-acetyltransferase